MQQRYLSKQDSRLVHYKHLKGDTIKLWYSIVRIFIFILFFLVFLILYKRKKKILRGTVIAFSFVVAMALCSMSSLMPVENLFITFSSPQNVFNYSIMGNMGTVIEGKDSALILYSYRGSESYSVIPKAKNGWKIGTYLSYEEVFAKTWQNGDEKIHMIRVYECKHTNDYYVVIHNFFSKNPINISDNRNSLFQKNKSSIDPSTTYYSYVYNIGQDYELTIDGEIIHINAR